MSSRQASSSSEAKWATPDLRRVAHRAAELLERRLLAGHGLHHVWPGDEHVARLLDHEDEVRHRRRVHGAARARSHDQADLRDHAAALDVADEYVAVGAERDHAFLDPRSAGVVDPDHGAADLRGQIHDLAHLLGHHLAERATEHGEVLTEHAHATAVDRAVPGHHGIAVGPVLLHLEVRGPVAHERVELLERARIEQLLDPLARGVLALGVLLLDGDLRAGMDRVVAQLLELFELLFVGLWGFFAHAAGESTPVRSVGRIALGTAWDVGPRWLSIHHGFGPITDSRRPPVARERRGISGTARLGPRWSRNASGRCLRFSTSTGGARTRRTALGARERAVVRLAEAVERGGQRRFGIDGLRFGLLGIGFGDARGFPVPGWRVYGELGYGLLDDRCLGAGSSSTGASAAGSSVTCSSATCASLRTDSRLEPNLPNSRAMNPGTRRPLVCLGRPGLLGCDRLILAPPARARPRSRGSELGDDRPVPARRQPPPPGPPSP